MTGGKVPARRNAEKTLVANTGAAVLVPVGLNVEKEKAQQSELMLGETGGVRVGEPVKIVDIKGGHINSG